MAGDGSAAGPTTKSAVRVDVLARRRARSAAVRDEAAAAIASHVLSLRQVAEAGTVAAYSATPGEPETRPLLQTLLERRTTVLLPLLRGDFDLDWAALDRIDGLRPGRFGLLEPTSAALGQDAIRRATVIVCPGVAADRTGNRLGRGGGSYDRVLSRSSPGALRCVVLYDDEVLDVVPAEGHDEKVDVIVTPSRIINTSADRR